MSTHLKLQLSVYHTVCLLLEAAWNSYPVIVPILLHLILNKSLMHHDHQGSFQFNEVWMHHTTPNNKAAPSTPTNWVQLNHQVEQRVSWFLFWTLIFTREFTSVLQNTKRRKKISKEKNIYSYLIIHKNQVHFSFISQRSIISQAFSSGVIVSYLCSLEVSNIILRNKITFYISPL